MNYDLLSTFGKILYASYCNGRTARATVDRALSLGKINPEEYQFIILKGAVE